MEPIIIFYRIKYCHICLKMYRNILFMLWVEFLINDGLRILRFLKMKPFSRLMVIYGGICGVQQVFSIWLVKQWIRKG